jgi:hypothetical protein
MLMKLLQNKGKAKISDIANRFLSHDQSQIEYYEQITKNMVGRVLTKNRGLTERLDDEYRLKGFDGLSSDEIKHLVSLCEEKVTEYIARRGSRIWEHRVKSDGYISGMLRYEIFKRAKFRCECVAFLPMRKLWKLTISFREIAKAQMIYQTFRRFAIPPGGGGSVVAETKRQRSTESIYDA